MDLPELIKTCKTERRAFEYLFNEIQEKRGVHCPACDCSDYYLMNEKRLRCKNCRRDYHPFSGTPISGLKISVISFLLLVKLFELEISARKASTQLDLSYPTTLKAFDLFRRSIACHLAKNDILLKGEIEADESYFGGRRKGKRGRGPVTRQLYLGSWNEGERFQSAFLRM
jgi:transposase